MAKLKKKKDVAKETELAEESAGTEESSKSSKVIRKSNKAIKRVITTKELLDLQKEGRLEGYDPATKEGIILEEGNDIKFPDGDTTVE